MAKPPARKEESELIEVQNQLSAMLHHNAEEGHRAILEQAMDTHIASEAAQRALFDNALNTQLRAAKEHRKVIERALDKSRRIETDHRATLQRALSRTHRNSLSQVLLKVPEARRTKDTPSEQNSDGGESAELSREKTD